MPDSQLLLFGSGPRANYWMTSACRRTSFILLFLSELLSLIFDLKSLWSAKFCHCQTFVCPTRIWTPRIRTWVCYANLLALWFCPSLSERWLIVQVLVFSCILSLRNGSLIIDELLTGLHRVCLIIVVYSRTIRPPIGHWTCAFLWAVLVALPLAWRSPAIVWWFSFAILERTRLFLH